MSDSLLALASAAQRDRVEVDFLTPTTATVALLGEHDVATSDALGNAFALAAGRRRHVLVDLSACSFIDSTVIDMLVRTRSAAFSHDGRIGLILPDAMSHPARVLAASGLSQVLPTYISREEALIAVEHRVRVRDLRARVGDPESFGADCECGWKGQPQSGELAERKARAEGTRHNDTPAPTAV